MSLVDAEIHDADEEWFPVNIWSAWAHIWNPKEDIERTDPNASLDRWPNVLKDIFGVLRRPEFKRLLLAEMAGDIPKLSRDLSVELIQGIRSAAPPGQSFIVQRRVTEILDAGNRLSRWKVPIPMIPTPLPPAPRSTFQSDDFDLLVRHSDIFSRFAKTLEPDANGEGQEEWYRILMCAALYSGLLQVKWLWSIPAALTRASVHLTWLDLYIDKRDGTRKLHLRWYPDAITRWLLVRLRKSGIPPIPQVRPTSQNLLKGFKRYAEKRAFAQLIPPTWQSLKSVIRMHLALYIPPYLLTYAVGLTCSTSLPPQVMNRLLSSPKEVDLEIQRQSRKAMRADVAGNAIDESPISADNLYDESEDDSTWPCHLRSLAAAIRGGKKKNSERISRWRQEVAESQRAIPASIARLADWLECWVFKSVRGRRGLKASTAYERYNAIAGRLVGQLGAADPAKWTSEGDFIALYANALEDASSPGARQRVAKGLRNFHNYLVKHHGAPEVAIGGHGRVIHEIDANLITPALFERAMVMLHHRFATRPEIAKLLVLVASLGFYAGHRRSEALGILLADLDTEPAWDLVIRPNDFRLLKSGSAERVLPLKLLLPEDRFDELKQWRQEVVDKAQQLNLTPNEVFLLSPDGVNQLRDTSPLLENITLALIQVSHDPTFRFHHLRHSFANRMLLMLWEAEQPEHERRPWWMPDLVGLNSKQVREQLLGVAPVQRRGLRLVSRLLGHSGTDITLEHYVHVLDYLLGRSTRRALPELSAKEIAKLTGLGTRYVQTVRKKTGARSIADVMDALTDRALKENDRLGRVQEAIPQVRIRPPEDLLARKLLITKLLNDWHLNRESDDASPWEVSRIGEWYSTIAQLPEPLRKRPGSMQTNLVDLPRSQAEKQLARNALHVLDGYKASEREAVLAVVNAGLSPIKLDLKVNYVTGAKRWLTYLQELDVLNLFDVTHIANRSSKAGSAVIQRKHWENALGMKIIVGATNSLFASESARGSLAFQLKEGLEDDRRRALYGVRWALAIGRVRD